MRLLRGTLIQFTFLLKALEGYPNWLEDVSPDLIFQDVNPSHLDSFLCRGATLGFCLLLQPLHLYQGVHLDSDRIHLERLAGLVGWGL